MFSAPHSATIRRLVLTYQIAYVGGTAAFNPGQTLTGATSNATATILSTSGVVASGTLTIFNISGVFQNGEALSDDGAIPGAATSSSLVTQALDKYGQPAKTPIDTNIKCRFSLPTDTYPASGKSYYIQTDTYVMIPPGYTFNDGDLIIGYDNGFDVTSTIYDVMPYYMIGGLHHWGAHLKKVD